jgi:hypothetical protein
MSVNPYLLASHPLAYETTGIELPSSPVVNVTNDNMDMSYRSVGTDAYFVLECPYPVDTIAMLHTNQRSIDTFRVRAADTVAALTSGAIYDSGTVAAYVGRLDAPYSTKSRILLPAPISARYWRFDFASPGHPDGQVIVSRVLLGERFEIAINDAGGGINYGWEKQVIDDSPITSGPNYEDVLEYVSRPGVKASFGTMDEATFNDLDVFMMRVGTKKPVLFSPEPDNLETDQHWTVYGRIKNIYKGQNAYHQLWESDIEIAGLRA